MSESYSAQQAPPECERCGEPTLIPHKTFNDCAAAFRNTTRALYAERATLSDRLSDALSALSAAEARVTAAQAEGERLRAQLDAERGRAERLEREVRVAEQQVHALPYTKIQEARAEGVAEGIALSMGDPVDDGFRAQLKEPWLAAALRQRKGET